MSSVERREEKRLQRVFRRALLVALAAPVACSSQGAQAPGSGDAPSGSGTTDSGRTDSGRTDSGTTGSGTASSGATGTGATAGTGTTSSGKTGTGTGAAAGTGGAASATTMSSGSTTAGPGGVGGAGTVTGAGGAGGGEADGGAEASCDPYGFMPNTPDTCGNYVRLPCGLPAGVTPGDNCYLYISDCSKFCPGSYFNCHAVDASCTDAGTIVNDPQGGVDLDCSICAGGVGRAPAGLVRAPRGRSGSSLGDHFAAAAHLEAASVHAFRLLHAELAAHHAPAELLRGARRAERDEVRHARVTARLARRFGGAPAPARVARVAERALDEVALENAVEGCVRETFGALVAGFQAERAADPAIRRAMKGIARDETRHAALSWCVARWASRRIEEGARARLQASCRRAIEALRREAGAGVDGELATRAGLPNAAEQRALLSVLEARLWRGLPA